MAQPEFIDTVRGRRAAYRQLDGSYEFAAVCKCGAEPSLECPIDDHLIAALNRLMMEGGPMPEMDGTFTRSTKLDAPCRKCGAIGVTERVWESSDGAYEDYKYTCDSCGYVWLVDGIDA